MKKKTEAGNLVRLSLYSYKTNPRKFSILKFPPLFLCDPLLRFSSTSFIVSRKWGGHTARIVERLILYRGCSYILYTDPNFLIGGFYFQSRPINVNGDSLCTLNPS
jgi:hypothetical protein